MKNEDRYLYIKTKEYSVFIDMKKVKTVFDLIFQLFSELGTETIWGSNKDWYFKEIENIKFTKDRLKNW